MEQNRKRYSSLAKAIQSEYAEYGGSAKFFFRGIRLF